MHSPVPHPAPRASRPPHPPAPPQAHPGQSAAPEAAGAVRQDDGVATDGMGAAEGTRPVAVVEPVEGVGPGAAPAPRAGTPSAVRFPRQPPAPRGDLAAGLAPVLATVVTGARRRALRDGDRQIDTAHLLHALVESDPEAGAAFESGHQRARVLGYLVQRSIGYGLRWQRSVEESAVRRALPAVRAATGAGGRGSAWSPAAATVLEEAFRRAAARGEEHARGLDVLAVVAADPESRAAEVLRGAGVDPVVLAARAEERIASRVAGRTGDRIEGRSPGRIEALPAAGEPSHKGASQQA